MNNDINRKRLPVYKYYLLKKMAYLWGKLGETMLATKLLKLEIQEKFNDQQYSKRTFSDKSGFFS